MLHLIKLAVGAPTIADIVAHQAARAGADPVVAVPTRQFPKRAAELENGGSLYWVIAGLTGARQPIRAVRPITRADGTSGTLILLDRAVLPVAARRVRAFQGWRYLTEADAPADDRDGTGGDEAATMPGRLRRALAELCLL